MKNIIFDPPTDLKFIPGDYVPFKDREVCERLRKISGKDLEKHPNPDFNIKVMMNPHPVLIATLFSRIKEASENSKKNHFDFGKSRTRNIHSSCTAYKLF